RLYRAHAGSAKRREELAAAADGEVAGARGSKRGTDIEAQKSKFLVPPLRFLERSVGSIVGDSGSLLLRERLGQSVDLVAQHVVLVAQFVQLAGKLGVFALEILQGRQNVIQLVETLENLSAAFLLLLHEFLKQGGKHIVGSTFFDQLSLAVRDRENHAAIHEPTFFSPVVDFRRALAIARSSDLVRRSSILDQESLDGFSASERQLVVVGGSAHVIGVTRYLHTIISVL